MGWGAVGHWVRQMGRDAVRYGITGTGAVVVDYLTFIGLAHGAGVSAPAAQAVSRAAGGLASFAGHRFWTFRHRVGPGMAGPFVRFWLVWGGMYGLSIGAIALAVRWIPEGPVRAKVLADVSVGVLTFVVQRHWTFRG